MTRPAGAFNGTKICLPPALPSYRAHTETRVYSAILIGNFIWELHLVKYPGLRGKQYVAFALGSRVLPLHAVDGCFGLSHAWLTSPGSSCSVIRLQAIIFIPGLYLFGAKCYGGGLLVRSLLDCWEANPTSVQVPPNKESLEVTLMHHSEVWVID